MRDVEGVANKKSTELVDQRADAAFLINEFAATQREPCELAHTPRSTFRYQADNEKDNQLRKKLTELAQEQPRYEYRVCKCFWEGRRVRNHKRFSGSTKRQDLA